MNFLLIFPLFPDVDSLKISKDGDVVNLMTLHCAKGLEFCSISNRIRRAGFSSQ